MDHRMSDIATSKKRPAPLNIKIVPAEDAERERIRAAAARRRRDARPPQAAPARRDREGGVRSDRPASARSILSGLRDGVGQQRILARPVRRRAAVAPAAAAPALPAPRQGMQRRLRRARALVRGMRRLHAGGRQGRGRVARIHRAHRGRFAGGRRGRAARAGGRDPGHGVPRLAGKSLLARRRAGHSARRRAAPHRRLRRHHGRNGRLAGLAPAAERDRRDRARGATFRCCAPRSGSSRTARSTSCWPGWSCSATRRPSRNVSRAGHGNAGARMAARRRQAASGRSSRWRAMRPRRATPARSIRTPPRPGIFRSPSGASPWRSRRCTRPR